MAHILKMEIVKMVINLNKNLQETLEKIKEIGAEVKLLDLFNHENK